MGKQGNSNNTSIDVAAPLEKLLQLVKRQFVSSRERPPDAAASALGREIGLAMLQQLSSLSPSNGQMRRGKASNSPEDKQGAQNQPPAWWKSTQEGIFKVLFEPEIHPSIPHAFFYALEEYIRKSGSNDHGSEYSFSLHETFNWLPHWLLHLEEDCQEYLLAHGGGGGGLPSSPSSASSFSRLRNSSVMESLTACLRTYAVYLVYTAPTRSCSGIDSDPTGKTTSGADEETYRQEIVDTYGRCQLPSSRMTLVRETTSLVFGTVRTSSCVRSVLSPIAAATLLPSTSCDSFESRAFAHHFWRAVWKSWYSQSSSRVAESDNQKLEDCSEYLLWAADILDLYLNTMALPSYLGGDVGQGGADSVEESVAAVELAETWFCEIIQFAQVLWEQVLYADDNSDESADDDDDDSDRQERHQPRERLSVWLRKLLRETLPGFLDASKHARLAWKPLLEALLLLLETVDGDGVALELDDVTVLRLCTAVSVTPMVQDRSALLAVLKQMTLSSSGHCHHSHSVGWSILRACSSIYLHDVHCGNIALQLQRQLVLENNEEGQPQARTKMTSSSSCFHVVNLLNEELYRDKENPLLDVIFSHGDAAIDFTKTAFSSAKQLGALYFGIAALDEAGDELHRKRRREAAWMFLQRLLSRYPHLGIPLMPVVLDRIHQASLLGDGTSLVVLLEFACKHLVANAHCAQEVWNLVGWQWMNMHTPVTVRILMIRLYPKLCMGNRRLGRRVLDTLGLCVSDRQPEVRLAVSATLADLAKDDCIRDVADVIDWIQEFLLTMKDKESTLSPTHHLLVHYAVMSLHYLIVAQEMDFDLVIKVLNKKLHPISDCEGLLKVLPPIVVEALILLLGDGECDEDEDDSEGNDDDGQEARAAETPVSPQVSAAVHALIHVGTALGAQARESSDLSLKKQISRARSSVFLSLSKYSLRSLGVDEESVRAATAGGEGELPDFCRRYVSLRELVVSGLEDCAGERVGPLRELTSTLLSFEEEVLGASLWQKRLRSQAPSHHERGASLKPQDKRSILPTPSRVRDIANKAEDPTAAAIANLLSCDGTQVECLRDNADASIDCVDPVFLILAIQGYLQTSQRLLSARSFAAVDELITEIRGWFDVFVSIDSGYLALSSFCVYVDPELCEDGAADTPFVEKISEDVMDAFKNQKFDMDDMSKICLGLVGVGLLRCKKFDRVKCIVGLLEQSVRGYGGQQSFGSYYALAMIIQVLPHYLESMKEADYLLEEAKQLITRVTSFLVGELLSCYEDGQVSLQLVDCLKNGSASDDLSDTLSEMDSGSKSLLVTKQVVARYLFISCALALPALKVVNDNLLLASFRLLDTLEWGNGKGIAIASVLQSCHSRSLLSEDELEGLHSEYDSVFMRRIESDEPNIETDGLDDIFYAVNGMLWKATPQKVRSLLVGNRDLFDDDGCVLSLVACVQSISSVPCLGSADTFKDPAQLDARASRSDLKSVVRTLADATKQVRRTKYSSMGMILMAMLSTVSSPERKLPAPQESSTGDAAKLKSDTGVAIDFSRLPQPRDGTLLAGVIDCIERFWSEKPNIAGRALASLESLSIPGPYAEGMLETLMRGQSETRNGCVMLLSSQLRGRRRAAFDGKDYVKLATKVALSSSEQWCNLLGDGGASRLFVQELGVFGLKMVTNVLEDVLASVWQKCLQISNDRREMISSFLSSCRRLLMSTSLSPKATASIRRFIFAKVFADLRRLKLESITEREQTSQPSNSILRAYIQCLREIPLGILDEESFFINTPKREYHAEVLRSLSTLELAQIDYFGAARRDSEVGNILAWVSSKLSAASPATEMSEVKDSLRRVSLGLAYATRRDNSAKKCERLATLFEILLLSSAASSGISLELLAVVLAFWESGNGSDGQLTLGYLCVAAITPSGNDDNNDEHICPPFLSSASSSPSRRTSYKDPATCLDTFFCVLLRDLPSNLASFARREKITATVINSLHRLYGHWAQLEGVDGSSSLSCVGSAICACQDDDTQEDAFVMLTSTIMTR